MVALLTIPSIAAQRYEGTSFILTTSEFRDCQYKVDNGTNFRTISCHHPITEHMENKTPLDLKNYFYWIIKPYGLPEIVCIVEIISPRTLNYTYSINIPLEYTITASNLTWAEIRGTKSFQNLTLSGLLSGNEQFDVPYDDNYTVTVYGNTSGGRCEALATFIVDRTSEFNRNKATLVGIIIVGLLGIAFYLLYLSRYLADHFKPLVYALSFSVAYFALSIAALAQREYIKVVTLNSNLGNIISMSIYASTLIAMIMLVFFIANILLKARTWKKEEGEL